MFNKKTTTAITMLNKKIISVIAIIIIIGISLAAVDLFSNTESQSLVVEDSDTLKITGKYAKEICNVIETPCPENVEFDGTAGPNNSVEYKYASKKSIYYFKILDQQLEFMGKKFVDGEWQVVADEWTVLINGDDSYPIETFSEITFENDYDEYGLKINFVELREIFPNNSVPRYDTQHTATVDKNSMYTVVSEIQNRDDIEKDFFYEVILVAPNGDVETSKDKETILPYDTMLVDSGGSRMYPGEYAVEVYLYEHRSVRDQAIPVSQVWFLEEKENEN